MHPVLFRIGSIPVYSYSTFAVLAFFASFLYVFLEARRLGEDTDKVYDIAIYIFLAAIVGSRLLHVIVEWQRFIKEPLDVFKLWHGGLAYYGGFVLCIITCIVFIKYNRLDFAKWADMLAPAATISLALGRIGCFLNGCCYGKPAPEGLPWAVVFPPARMPLHLAGVPLHPTQIYSSISATLVSIILIVLSRKKRYNGQVVWSMCLLYSASRFILEYFRGDPRGRLEILNLSTSQAIGIPIMICAAVALIYLEIKFRSSRSCRKKSVETT